MPIIVFLIWSTIYLVWVGKSIFYNPNKESVHQKTISSIPHGITFAGEEVHFKTPTTYQLYYRELKLNQLTSTRLKAINKKAKKVIPIISKIFKKNKIPDDFIYIPIAESYLNNNIKSSQGAAGIWQMTKSTALSLGLEVNEEVDERLDLVKSSHAAAKFILQAKNKFGNWTSAAAAYNRGLNGLERAMIKQGENSYYDLALNRETASYIYKLLAIKYQLKKYSFKEE